MIEQFARCGVAHAVQRCNKCRGLWWALWALTGEAEPAALTVTVLLIGDPGAQLPSMSFAFALDAVTPEGKED